MADTSQVLTRERFAQLVRAGLPFNAVSGQEMGGANLDRLRRGMKALDWDDPRFVTMAEAQGNGWTVKPDSASVQILVRDTQKSTVETLTLFNAASIDGMPTLDAMLAMSESEMALMSGQGEVAVEADGGVLAIVPARVLDRAIDEANQQVENGQPVQVDEYSRVIEASFNGLMAVPRDALAVEEVREWVAADVAALRNIINMDERFFAAAMIGSMAEDQRAYKEELTRQAPDIVAEVESAVAEDRRRSEQKEDRKLAEMRELDAAVPEQPAVNDEVGGPAADVKLEPGYSRLFDHGAAPYEHDPKNSGSYFAILENAEGERSTVWGVDIERSLAEAGVAIGDPIALTRGGKEKVSVNVRQPDDTFVEKMVDRFKWNTERQPIVQEQAQTHSLADGSTAGIEAPVAKNGYAVLAPYWVDGLHNPEGVALAEEINKAIKAGNIAKDKVAIERLMAVHPRASELGLQVVLYERYRDDPYLRANSAQPRTLLNGALVRDKEGAYRPAAGGRPVLVDQGDAVLLKTKDADGYRAAMELAVAKGWTAIELKGKPAMLAEAWLEAKLKGLDVVNYIPNEKDKAKYMERVAEESARKMQAETRATEQTPEMVEVRPFVDANGQQKEALVTYTIETQGTQPQGNAKGAAQVRPPAASMPSVLRTVTRVDGLVRPDTIAGINVVPGKSAVKFVDEKLDREASEAIAEINEEEHALASLSPVAIGSHIGPIVAVQGNLIGQKTGRDPDQITWHDMSKLNGSAPKLGEMADIKYANGFGLVKEEPARERELAGEGRGLER